MTAVDMFQFKQFAVDQSGCAMKINTDGVLLGALANADEPKTILDIGTGTGVIALMLAQRFANAQIDAVEIDENAAVAASRNFKASKFGDRLKAYHTSFETFFDNNPKKLYDLIVSNPPFYINSLKSPAEERSKAKHADELFFDKLITQTAKHLSENGLLWLILPIETSDLVQKIAAKAMLYVQQITAIASYPNSIPHRHIIAFSFRESYLSTAKLIIYQEPRIYSESYKDLLKDFFTIF